MYTLTQQAKMRPKSGHPGANLMIVSYNASAVKIYNATSSLVRLKQKHFL
jgi:hypothetical protein